MISLSTVTNAKSLAGELPFGRKDAALLLVLPGLFLFASLMLYPVVYLIWLSMTNAAGPETLIRGEAQFIGLQNYVNLFTDGLFWNSLAVTWLFVVTTVAMKLLVGIGIALVLTSERVIGKRYMRALVILPMGFPAIFTITIWRQMFSSARFGTINEFMFIYRDGVLWLQGLIDAAIFWTTVQPLGFLIPDLPIAWLSTRWMAFAAYNVTEIWLAYPFMVIIIISALQSQSQELHDAARVDGAGYWMRFFHVTLPAIKRPVWFAAILTAAASFQQFLIPWVFNRGGPSRQNELLLVYGYREALSNNRFGLGAAIMIVALIFIGLFMWVNVKKGRLAEGIHDV